MGKGAGAGTGPQGDKKARVHARVCVCVCVCVWHVCGMRACVCVRACACMRVRVYLGPAGSGALVESLKGVVGEGGELRELGELRVELPAHEISDCAGIGFQAELAEHSRSHSPTQSTRASRSVTDRCHDQLAIKRPGVWRQGRSEHYTLTAFRMPSLAQPFRVVPCRQRRACKHGRA